MLHQLFKPRRCLRWGSSRAVLASLLVGVVPAFAQKVPDVPLKQRIMPLTQAQAQQNMRDMWAAQRSSSAKSPSASLNDQCTSIDLYPLLYNVPSQRNQGGCGNCWAWASTGTMEIALNVQNGIRDRLSLQFINSCDPWKSCCGAGGFADFRDFYAYEGFAIPWSNAQAGWSSGGGACIPCSSISTSPRYPISSIGYHTVPTKGVGQAAAIANIKAELCASNGLYFYFNVPNQADWDTFDNFFFNQTENDIWNNAFCNHTWDNNTGGGHVVLCVGFVDDGGANRYWIMLNSWGAWGSSPASGRPTGKYRVSMDIDYNCAPGLGFQAIDVCFNLPPVITSQPVSTTNCQGTTASFSVSTPEATCLTYQWQKNGTNLSNGGRLSGATSSTLTLSNVSTNDAGTYSVVLNYGSGTTNSAPATLTVPVPPNIVTNPQSQSVCQGSSVSLSVTATGTALSYQWQFNGTNIGGNQSYYSNGHVHANNGGTYTVIVSNGCGIVTSAPAILTVSSPPVITNQPQSQVATLGAGAFLSVGADGTPAPSYQWQFNGTNVGGNQSYYSNGHVHANNGGAYTAILSNACGPLTSSVAWLAVVMPLPDQTGTQGAAVTLSVTNYGRDPSLAWQWQKNGVNLSNGGNVSGAASPALTLCPAAATDAGGYTVVVGNGVGSSVTVGANLNLVVPPRPRFDRITRLANGSVQLWMSGTPGCFYGLQSSSNWLNWGTLCTTSSADGCFQYIDSCPAYNRGQLFYRLKLAP